MPNCLKELHSQEYAALKRVTHPKKQILMSNIVTINIISLLYHTVTHGSSFIEDREMDNLLIFIELLELVIIEQFDMLKKTSTLLEWKRCSTAPLSNKSVICEVNLIK